MLASSPPGANVVPSDLVSLPRGFDQSTRTCLNKQKVNRIRIKDHSNPAATVARLQINTIPRNNRPVDVLDLIISDDFLLDLDKIRRIQPVAHVHRVDHPNDTAMRQHAWRMATALYKAAGARQVYRRGPFASTHNLGTCRQSAKRRDGVCNSYGQTHDIKNLFISDGSQFTTSAAENPTLTIVALAIRQADYLADEMKQGNL